MNKKKLIVVENAIKEIAKRDGVTVEFVKMQMKIAMMNGVRSTDSKAKSFWDNISGKGKILTPEELIIHTSELVKQRKSQE
ncbi:hypothetical protein [Desulfosporosinus meridiei]|uniref:Sporulation initiation factor Spo0A C terminal n=1 Tax=Desulfosporosinus meridiei (strain ATCC BAA-275 / DSM 13257 / KCTC 12902 / NCIMB 13706 / S10) TaxID=768704 RepID=J7ISZ3_DESMD|nr:hypothetical protein [Desulfosporosinus meridiei]AFQ43284.1 hypothetical protein Desmer_1271 [Desulfosporosinus meridiei DSM 13257]